MLQQHNTQRKHPLPSPSASGPIQNTIEDVVISSDHKASFEEGVVAPHNPVYAATTSQLLDCDGKWLNFRPTTADIPSENFYPYPAYELSFWCDGLLQHTALCDQQAEKVECFLKLALFPFDIN